MSSARLLAVAIVAVSIPSAMAETFHVSPGGKDIWSGRLPTPQEGDGPFATLARAKEAVRESIKAGLKEPVRVVISERTYFLTEPLIFTPDDSGTGQYPVTYEAAEGATPTLSGGRVVRGWRKEVTGELWSAPLGRVRDGKWLPRQLFLDGKRLTRARRPNAEDYWFQATKNLGVKEGVGSFSFAGDDLQTWDNLGEVELVLLRTWDVSRYRILSLDEQAKTVTFRVPEALNSITHWRDDGPYFVENAREFLDSPGEWFLERSTGMLRLWPPAGADMTKATAIMPALEHLIRFEGTPGKPVQHLAFRGLAFKHTTWTLGEEGYDGHQADVGIGAGTDGDYAESIRFEKCTFSEQGRYALRFRKGCRNVVVDGCEFAHLGGGSVMIGDAGARLPKEPEQTRDNTVSNCHIHHTGEVYPGSPGLWVGYASGNRILNNHVHHTSYTGISVGWGWTYEENGAHHNLIEGNHLHDIQLVLGDGAGIYTLSRQPGTVIRNNVIHDVNGYLTYGVGIYLDNNSSDIVVENNLVARTIGASFVNNAVGRDNVIRNNIFALPATGAFHLNGCKDNRIEGNIVYLAEGTLANAGWKDQGVASMDRNLYFLAGEGDFLFGNGRSFDEWQADGFDRNSLIADPKFADVAKGDFSLKPDSPALTKLGFKPLTHNRVIGTAPPDRRDDPRLVKLFALSAGLRNKQMTPQMVVHPRSEGEAVALSPSAPTGPAQPKSLEGLVAWWPFEKLLPSVPNRHLHGEVVPEVVSAAGVVGQGLKFDGATGKLDVPYSDLLNLTDAITISAWIKPEAKQHYKGAFGILERPQIYRFMLMEPEAPFSISLSLMSDQKTFFGATSKREVRADEWTFVVGTFDSASGKTAVYLNGKLSTAADTTPGTKILTRKGTGLQIGRRDANAYFNGVMDEVKLYGRTLTVEEIAGEFAASSAGR